MEASRRGCLCSEGCRGAVESEQSLGRLEVGSEKSCDGDGRPSP